MYIRVGDFDELQILIFSKNVGYFKRITATYKGIPNFVDVSNNNPVHGLGRRIREPLDYCMWFIYLFVFYNCPKGKQTLPYIAVSFLYLLVFRAVIKSYLFPYGFRFRGPPHINKN